MKHSSSRFLASLGLMALACAPLAASAAVAPDLGSAVPYAIVSETYTNTVAGTTINGNLCYSGTGPAVVPTVNGTTGCDPFLAGDLSSAFSALNSQSPCTLLGSGNLTGTYTPGCYEYPSGALGISVNGIVTLNGPGVYIFRSNYALTTGANSQIQMAGGACANNVFWALGAAASLGADSTFVGNIFTVPTPGGVTIGHNITMTGRALAVGATVSTDSDTITSPSVCASVVPTISKRFAPTTVDLNQVSRLTITLSNPTAAVANLEAALVDNLPAGLFIAATPNATTTCLGSGAVVAVAGGTSVTLPSTRSIPAAVGGTPGTCTVSVNVSSPTAGNYVNTIPAGALQTSNGDNPAPATATLIVAEGVPALPAWAVMALMALLSLAGFAAMRRRAV